MEDSDNAKTRNSRECVVTNLNSYLTYISDIKETIKKEEGAEEQSSHKTVFAKVPYKWGRFGVTSVTPFLLFPVHPEGCTPAHRT